MNLIVTFNRFCLTIPFECMEECSHSGRCDDDVEWWAPRVMGAVENCDIAASDIAAELREYGAWTDEELQDLDRNNERIVWIAACNAREEL